MKKIILSMALLLTLAGTIPAQEQNKDVKYHFFVNDIPSGFDYPLVGIINKVNGDHASIQLGVINSTRGNFSGGQAGFVNAIGRNVKGIQYGFVNAIGGDLSGVQYGFVNAIGGKVYGVQTGFINTTGNNLTGVQSGFINTAGKITGLQYGFLNSTHTLRGLQLGFINTANNVEAGLPVGFLSFVKKGGYKAIELSYNDIYPLNIAFKTGVRFFYTYPVISYNTDAEDKLAIGYGAGSNIDLCDFCFVNPELQSLRVITEDFVNYSTLKLNIGFTVGSRLELLAGPEITWKVKINDEDYHHEYDSFDPDLFAENKLITGLNVAVRYKF